MSETPTGPMQPTQPQAPDTKVWQLIAWIFSIIGAIIAYLAGPKEDAKLRHWIRMSIAFFIVAVIAYIIIFILAFIPIIGWALGVLIGLGMLVIWIIGILKILQGELWNPPIVSRVAEHINL